MNHLSRAKQILVSRNDDQLSLPEDLLDTALLAAEVALADAAERIAHQLELIAKNAVEA